MNCENGAGIRGIGLLTAPGEFHGLTADPGESDPRYQTFGQKISRNGIVWAQTGHSTCTCTATLCVVEL